MPSRRRGTKKDEKNLLLVGTGLGAGTVPEVFLPWRVQGLKKRHLNHLEEQEGGNSSKRGRPEPVPYLSRLHGSVTVDIASPLLSPLMSFDGCGGVHCHVLCGQFS
jgi:hypothetical protein